MRTSRLVLTIVGAIIALLGLGTLLAGAGLAWAHTTQRDAAGFYTSPTYDLATDGYAITTDNLHLGANPADWFPTRGDLTFRVTVTPDDPAEDVFLGIADEADLRDYLRDVSHERVQRIEAPFGGVRTQQVEGGAPATAPGEADLWVASTEGTGTQTLTWDAERGSWGLAVMAADGSAGIAVDTSAGVRTGLLLPIGVGLLVAGLVVLVVGGVMVVVGASGAGGAGTTPADATAADRPRPTSAHPVALEAHLDPDLSRWRWLVKWLLALPHILVLAFLWAAFVLLTVVAGFAILFTGRYPRGIFDFNVGVLRWTWRVNHYAYGVLGTDRYPPFSLAPDPNDPASFDVAYPERLSRGLVLVKWWLLAIPHYVIVGLLTGGAVSWTLGDGNRETWEVASGGLIGVLVLVAGFALLFTGRYPRGLYDLVVGLQRWVYRVVAYAALMTDVYPPFRLDTGGSEPPVAPTPPTDPTADGGASRELTNA